MLDPNLEYKGVGILSMGPQIFLLPPDFSPVSGHANQRRGSGAENLLHRVIPRFTTLIVSCKMLVRRKLVKQSYFLIAYQLIT